MEKIDLTKQYKTYYTAKTKPEIATIEKAHYLSISGKGDPSSEEFSATIEALYPVAYAVKFLCKEQDKDFVVAKLEGLWWFDEKKYGSTTMDTAPKEVPRSEWEYRLLIRMPDFVTESVVKKAIETVITKKKIERAKKVEFYTMTEGKVVQMLHVGPFDTEPETLRLLNEFITENNLQRNGLHHEIYLSDFRKTPPEKLKTILREPVK